MRFVNINLQVDNDTVRRLPKDRTADESSGARTDFIQQLRLLYLWPPSSCGWYRDTFIYCLRVIWDNTSDF
ncbi:hypothetical protein JZ751_014819 [Albula glossodonta]|uniref:Uncharacterized protein n=1 Tax=Albula glossodonta TaxID=121402 RepID=A0A8T2MZU1_9TELE|nr:hypothetical protein JZ751_014819 [Albula glossodonta]